MNDDQKVPCTKNDLDKAEEIFSNVIRDKLSDSKLNTDKIIQDFRKLLQESFVIQPSPEDDRESQELKDKIEKIQKKALRLKNTLEVHRNQIITDVRAKVEQMLEEKSPKIEDLNEQEIFDDEIHDEEFKQRLSIFDSDIEKILSQLSKSNPKMKTDAEQFEMYKNNAMDIESFLSSCS